MDLPGPLRKHGWIGIAAKALPLVMAVGFPLVLGYVFIHNARMGTNDVIPNVKWETSKATDLLAVRLPGKPVPTTAFFESLEIDGHRPATILAWRVPYNDAFFYIGVTEYSSGTVLTPDVFRKLTDDLKRDVLERVVFDEQVLMLDGREGRQWQFTRPYSTMRAYIDGMRLVVLATDWYGLADRKTFFDSFRFGSDAADIIHDVPHIFIHNPGFAIESPHDTVRAKSVSYGNKNISIR